MHAFPKNFYWLWCLSRGEESVVVRTRSVGRPDQFYLCRASDYTVALLLQGKFNGQIIKRHPQIIFRRNKYNSRRLRIRTFDPDVVVALTSVQYDRLSAVRSSATAPEAICFPFESCGKCVLRNGGTNIC